MTNVSSAFLIDTNLLVYVYDPRDRTKQEVAFALVNLLIERNLAAISAQCLSEFYRVVTSRIPEPMTTAQALVRINRLAQTCRVLDVTSAVVLEGCRGAAQHGMSIWDALIWAVAKLNQIPYVLTEDAEHGRTIEGVGFLNPFSSAFHLDVR